MVTWNDTDSPLAFLITFRSYGTWLHGDERGSIDRYHNQFRGPRVPQNSILETQQRVKLKSEPLLLDAEQRSLVENAIREVCDFRKWGNYSTHVRTNHTHAVIANHGVAPENILRDLKAYATRALRNADRWAYSHSPWVDGGSKRYLWTEASVVNACDYVINGQGADLPESF